MASFNTLCKNISNVKDKNHLNTEMNLHAIYTKNTPFIPMTLISEETSAIVDGSNVYIDTIQTELSFSILRRA